MNILFFSCKNTDAQTQMNINVKLETFAQNKQKRHKTEN